MDIGDKTNAARQLKKVTAANILFGLRLDKRFDELRATNPAAFDIQRAAVADLQRLIELYKTAGNDDPAYEIIDALRALGRYDAAVTVADEVLKQDRIVDGHGKDYRNWIEDRRAYALFDLGRFDEAIAGERKAATRQERGHANVSQVLNLAQMLLDVGRFREALAILKPMERPNVGSPTGRAFVAQIRVCALNGLGRIKEQREAMASASGQLAENRAARLHTLLCADDESGAAKEMIAWLDEPRNRGRALLELSKPVADRPLGAYRAVLSRRFDEVRNDPAVVAAVAKVGHTETLTTVGADWPYYP
ncbi:hypothetical protein [Phenylobacterium sp.]|uniref:hypothetical protein n=1 Tax=Phenylobacterium sp. TaxID=1871053 RepID=UPI002F3F663A